MDFNSDKCTDTKSAELFIMLCGAISREGQRPQFETIQQGYDGNKCIEYIQG